MSNEINPDLIKSLIRSVESTNETVKELASNVYELVQIEKVREERDKHQEEKNKIYDEHIKVAEPILQKAKDSQEFISKLKVPVAAAFVIALLALLGFNFK